MGDNTSVQRLVDMLSAFFTEGRAVEEDLTCSLTSEFLRNIQDVLYNKQKVVFSRWANFFHFGWERMLPSSVLPSPENYLQYVMYACLQDAQTILNIFERFLSSFALILRISIETRYRTGINLCKLVPDIFMVFYEKELKKPFERRKGFSRFVQYVNNPNYLKSECIERNVACSYDTNVSRDEILKDSSEKILGLIGKNKNLTHRFNFEEVEQDGESSSLAKRVMEITKKLSDEEKRLTDLNHQATETIQEIQKELELLQKAYPKLTSDSDPSFNSYSETNDDALGQMSDNARYNSIIEAVIRHNHSISSCDKKSNNCFQMEAGRILENLKQTTKSLIDVLEEYGEE